MKIFVCFVALFGSILAGPIPEESKGFFVTTVNKTAVCVVKGSVYQDGERLPMDDPCEICRCRPPGFACAYVRCAKRDPKPGCNVVDLVGQCCPQYRCVEEEQPVPPVVPPAPEITTIKPLLLDDEPLRQATEVAIIPNEIAAKNDAISTSLPSLADEKLEARGEEAAKSDQPLVTESLPLEQRDGGGGGGLQPDSSSERPLIEELGKSLEIVSTQQPAELPREERVEFNEIHANENAVTEGNEDGRSDLLNASQAPVQLEKEIIAERSGVDEVTSFFLLAEATSLPEVQAAPSEEESASSQPPEKIERKDDDQSIEASSLPPLILKEQAVIIDDKAPVVTEGPLIVSQPITEQPLLPPVNESLPQQLREKRETIETLEEKELLAIASTLPPQPPAARDELKEKADEAELPGEHKQIDTKAEVHKDDDPSESKEVDEGKTDALLKESLPEQTKVVAAAAAEEHKQLPEIDVTTIQNLN